MLLSLFGQPDPDSTLVNAARGGDVRAFDALVHRYHGRMRQFVRSRLDSAIDSDDVIQDVFVSAWKELPGFRGRSRFKTWLFGIALHRCADAWRKHQRLRALLGEMEVPFDSWPEDTWGDNPEGWPAAVIERTELRRHLGRLSEAERQVLELYYYAELNMPEISALLDINLSTLKYRFYQAHRNLRRHLEEPVESPVGAPASRARK